MNSVHQTLEYGRKGWNGWLNVKPGCPEDDIKFRNLAAEYIKNLHALSVLEQIIRLWIYESENKIKSKVIFDCSALSMLLVC